MKEIHNIMLNFIKMINERIKLTSSNQSLIAYQKVKNDFCILFKDFTKDDIVISKEEYLDLLKNKLLISNYNYNSFDINDEEYDKIKQETQEKIDYLKLL